MDGQLSAYGIRGVDKEIAGSMCTMRRGLRQKLWGPPRSGWWFRRREGGSPEGNCPAKGSAQRCRRERSEFKKEAISHSM